MVPLLFKQFPISAAHSGLNNVIIVLIFPTYNITVFNNEITTFVLLLRKCNNLVKRFLLPIKNTCVYFSFVILLCR